MRIAYVCADGGISVFGEKGASVHVTAMANAMTRIGHDVYLLCARRGEGEADFPVEQVTAAAFVVKAGNRAEAERSLIETSAAIEARLIALHREQPFGMIYERYALWSTAGVRAGRRLGLPVVVEVNAPLVLEQAEYRALALADEARAIEAEVFGTADALAVVSDELVAYVTAHGAARDRVHVIGNAVDTRVFRPGIIPSRPESIPHNAFVIGFCGSLKQWHGLETLLPAFRIVQAKLPNAHLLVVGEGPRKAWVEGYAAGTGLDASVTLTGWVQHGALPRLIASMDVATAPYPVAAGHYFSPLKLYEYLAMGRPVVASRIGQTAALLDSSGAALLVPPGDVSALAEALLRVARDKKLAADMAAKAAAEGKRHDWTDNARRAVALSRAEVPA